MVWASDTVSLSEFNRLQVELTNKQVEIERLQLQVELLRAQIPQDPFGDEDDSR